MISSAIAYHKITAACASYATAFYLHKIQGETKEWVSINDVLPLTWQPSSTLPNDQAKS